MFHVLYFIGRLRSIKKLLVDVDARTALRLEDGEYKCFQATIDANSLPGSLSYPEGEGGGGGGQERTLGTRMR